MNQERALSILKTGANAFITGEPGSGKTYLINAYIAYLEACKLTVAVTASTGIAATHIGGMTIHSWSGIGARDSLSPYDLEHIASQQKTAKRVGKAHTLIIDEISMLDGKLLDMVDRVCRAVRKNNEAFGGLQVVFVGDFFQLPPIAKMGEAVRYAFESPAWAAARPVTCYLDGQFRQEDEMLLSLLQSIRRNEVEDDHYTLLGEQTDISYEHIEPTRLYTHNADVDAVNAAKLRELPGMARKFAMSGRGNKQLQESLAKNCLSPQLLELKEQAMVMCTKNNFEAGYVNGTLGRVIGFDPEDGFPIIETADGRRLPIQPVTWSVSEENKVLAEIEQVPLRLAWAITIHKSQGMSLDAAEIDLTRAFAYGQGYVALSRVRTLAGLKLLGMGPNALGVDPKIVAVDARFRQASDEADDLFADMEEEELKRLQEGFVRNNGGSMPSGRIPASPSRAAARLREESTYEETLRLLRDGRSVAQIAKERDIAESTVWTHLEKLREEGKLAMKDLHGLTSDPSWDDAYRDLKEGFEACGTEKLKPVFEYAKEAYGYPQVRLARIVYLLSGRG